MSTWDAQNFYFSGQGVVLIGNRTAAGKPAGLVPVGNVSELKISIATTVVEHHESQTGQRAIDLRLVTLTKGALAVTLENFIAENLATSLRGETTVRAAGSVSAEPIPYYSGLVVPFAHVKVSNVDVTGFTPFNAATPLVPYDYKLNADAGSILWNDGSVVAKDAAIATVDATNEAVDYDFETQNLVDALTLGQQTRYLRFEGLNTADGFNPVVIEVFKFVLDPTKDLELISDTIDKFVLDGSVLADQLQPSGSKFFKATLLR